MELDVKSFVGNFDSLVTHLFIPLFQSGRDAILNVHGVVFLNGENVNRPKICANRVICTVAYCEDIMSLG